jgi:hypothetical protein
MRKLRILAHISLDGVIQHEIDEGFVHGDWTAPYRTSAGLAAVLEAQDSRFDLLLGRRTYDAWAGYWPRVLRLALGLRPLCLRLLLSDSMRHLLLSLLVASVFIPHPNPANELLLGTWTLVKDGSQGSPTARTHVVFTKTACTFYSSGQADERRYTLSMKSPWRK